MNIELTQEQANSVLPKMQDVNAYLNAAGIAETNLISLRNSIQQAQYNLGIAVETIIKDNDLDPKQYKLDKLDKVDGKLVFVLSEVVEDGESNK
jgi:hypothetical protein